MARGKKPINDHVFEVRYEVAGKLVAVGTFPLRSRTAPGELIDVDIVTADDIGNFHHHVARHWVGSALQVVSAKVVSR